MEQQERTVQALISQCIERTREAATFEKRTDEEINELTAATDMAIKLTQSQIKKLENDITHRRDALEKEAEEKKNEKQAEWIKAQDLHRQIEEIIYFLGLSEKRSQDLPINNIVEYHGYSKDKKSTEDLGYIFEDTYVKVKALVVTNDKPKNRFTLIVAFQTIDQDFLKEAPHDSYFPSASIKSQWVRIKEFPSVNDALVYFEKHVRTLQHPIISAIIDVYNERKAEFEEILSTCTMDDVLDLRVLLAEWVHHDLCFDRIEEGIVRHINWKDEEELIHVTLDKERRILHVAKKEEDRGSVENYFAYYFPLRHLVKVEYNGG